MDPHNIWTSDYPSTLGGLSLGVIEVGQAGTAFLNEGVLMNETLCNKPHAASKQTCTVKACCFSDPCLVPTPPYHLCRCSALHQYIIYTDTLLCKEGKHNESEQITTQMAGQHQPPCDAMYACMGAIEKA